MNTKYLFFILFLTSCFGDKSATGTLKTYIEKRFNTKISKLEIKTYLTGSLLKNVDKLSEKEFNSFSKLNKHKFIDLEIISEECDELECVVTYNLSYKLDDLKSGNPNAKVKKIAFLVKEDNIWKISSIENLKTSYDFIDPLEVKAGTAP